MIYILSIVLLFYCVTCVIIVFILLYLNYVKKRNIQLKAWNDEADLLVSEALFREDDEIQLLFTYSDSISSKLKIKLFRSILSDKIVFTAKNISGISIYHLQQLYVQTALDEDDFSLINSSKWHLKAKGIQNLGIMGIRKALNKIFVFTNDSNELVRMEAQISVLKLSGFEGLRFLDNIEYQISEWQQIKLLQQLTQLRKEEFVGIDKWLISKNYSVVLFALKLVSNYHMFDLYQQCLPLLNHPFELIRIYTVNCLTQIYEFDTAKILLSNFKDETYKVKLEIIYALKEIGDEDIIDDLFVYLNDDNIQLKIALSRTISNISNNGYQKLIEYAQEYPLKQIMVQITSELNL